MYVNGGGNELRKVFVLSRLSFFLPQNKSFIVPLLNDWIEQINMLGITFHNKIEFFLEMQEILTIKESMTKSVTIGLNLNAIRIWEILNIN